MLIFRFLDYLERVVLRSKALFIHDNMCVSCKTRENHMPAFRKLCTIASSSKMFLLSVPSLEFFKIHPRMSTVLATNLSSPHHLRRPLHAELLFHSCQYQGLFHLFGGSDPSVDLIIRDVPEEYFCDELTTIRVLEVLLSFATFVRFLLFS